MKKVKLVLLIFVIYFITISSSFAQWGNYDSAIGGKILFNIPVDQFSNATKFGLGIEANYIYMLNENIGLIGKLGYLSWNKKSDEGWWGSEFKYSSFFLQPGIKINMNNDDLSPYVYSTVGLYFLKTQLYYTSIEDPDGQGLVDLANESGLNVNVGLGIEYKLNEFLFLDISCDYNIMLRSALNLQSIGFNVGVNYSIF